MGVGVVSGLLNPNDSGVGTLEGDHAMTKDTTKEAPGVAADGLSSMIGSTRSRTGSARSGACSHRDLMLEAELSEVLSRPRYGRRRPGEDEAAVGCPACATGIASGTLTGTFGKDADRRAPRPRAI